MEIEQDNKEIMHLEIIWKYSFPKLTKGVKVVIKRSFYLFYNKPQNIPAIKPQIWEKTKRKDMKPLWKFNEIEAVLPV